MLFPEDLGGWGLGHSDYVGVGAFRMFEEVARADSAMAVAFGVVFWPLVMICSEPHVNRRLCEEFAPMFTDTDKAVFAANAMTEPQGGRGHREPGRCSGAAPSRPPRSWTGTSG